MVDFLLVGQGLAGSVLALQLLQEGQRVFVLNNSQANISSTVAAGVYNPITGAKMSKSWLVGDLFPYLRTFYEKAQKILSVNFLHPMPIFRPFLTDEERAAWLQRSKQPDCAPFIEAIAVSPYSQAVQHYPHGGVVTKQSGYVDVPRFLHATRAYLKSMDAYQETDFHHDQLRLGRWVTYRHLRARCVIFCEGPQATKNPLFNTLPFHLVKGELLLGKLPAPLEVIYNRNVFLLPQVEGPTVVGATYDRQDKSPQPTLKAREMLKERLHRAFHVAYEVQAQRAGIRPATFDRKPLIGLHLRYPQVGIFNGLGSKGVSLAPYLAKRLVAHLLTQEALPHEVRLERRGVTTCL
jgi:glycine/D-amino acid oxidase-like deaminating enzyme